MDSNPLNWKIGLVGYGEVGRILAEDLRQLGVTVTACDIKLGTDQQIPLIAHAQQHQVHLVDSHAALAHHSDLVISAVTASQTLSAAKACAPDLLDTLFLDLNSASPGIKFLAWESVETAGGNYLEGAVMTTLPQYRIGVPLLIGGPHAKRSVEPLSRLGFKPKVVDGELGRVSATKMCRSVMIKGLEALLIESLTAARRYEVEDAVIDSLQETFPGINWERQASYMFSRVIVHGRRRAEEMKEAAQTVRDAGLDPCAATATAHRQACMAELTKRGCFGELTEGTFAQGVDWRREADRILAVGQTQLTEKN